MCTLMWCWYVDYHGRRRYSSNGYRSIEKAMEKGEAGTRKYLIVQIIGAEEENYFNALEKEIHNDI